MAKELKGVHISHISLVKKGANKKKIFLMKDDEDKNTVELNAVIKSFDELEGLVFCEVYTPYEADTDDHLMSSEEIEKTAHEYLIKARNVDLQHNFGDNIGDVVESYVVRYGDIIVKDAKGNPVLEEDGKERIIKNGSWVAGIKITNEEVLKEVKDGNITGFSMAGFAEKVLDSTIEPKDNSLFKSTPSVDEIKKEISENIAEGEEVEEETLDIVIKSIEDKTFAKELYFKLIKENKQKDENEKILNDINKLKENFEETKSLLKQKEEEIVSLRKEFAEYKQNSAMPESSAIDISIKKEEIKPKKQVIDVSKMTF